VQLKQNTINDSPDCDDLFALREARDGSRATNTLQAMINIAHNPAKNVDDLWAYAQAFPLYQPALDTPDGPDAWTLALRFTDRRRILDVETSGLPGLGSELWRTAIGLDRRFPIVRCRISHLHR